MYMLITSKDNKIVQLVNKLKQKKNRDSLKLYVIEGFNLVNEAYKKGLIDFIIVSKCTTTDFDVTTYEVDEKIMNYISDLESSSKILAVCHIEDDISITARVVILDGIQDPGNLGTIIRSCVAFNIGTLVISKDTVDLYNLKVLRAAQGMNYNINIIRSDICEIITRLKKQDYKIYGTDVINGINVKEIIPNDKFALVLGNEGKGVSPDIKNLCDENIYINMNQKCESLNVSVACSIILHQFDR